MRVQRTRSSPSALREPLTRHPLGRVGIAWAFMAAAVSVFALPAGLELTVTPSAAKPTLMVVEARNTSARPVSLDLVPTVELTDKAGAHVFWAPFQLAGPDHRLGANGRSRLSLAGHGVISVEIDMAALSWAEKRSAVWPDRSLKAVVPAGTYSLVVAATGEKGLLIRSKPASWVAP
jgi:hypothetical protein